ncbi:MAG TPA: ComEC/Rec2 family competence protein [bacterium]|nr:ComEC/Rec2 family competence protein [bacterium]
MVKLIYFISLISGILLGLNFNFSFFYLFLILFISIFTKRKTLIFAILFFICGLLSTSRIKKDSFNDLNFDNKKLSHLKCCVVSLNKISPFSSSFIVENNGDKFILELKVPANLEKGEIIEIKDVKIEKIAEKKNPWDFDSKKYYNRQGVFYTLKANYLRKIGFKNIFYRSIAKIRKSGEEKIERYLPYKPEERELLKTIVIGKDKIPYFLRTLGVKSGSYHLLVISGLHLSYIFLFLRIIFIPFAQLNNKHPKIFPSFALIFLWSYALITGLRIPIIRATLMFTFFLLGEIFERDIEGPDSIFIAAFLMLILNPISLFNLSFLLSFITTFTIIYTVRKFNFIKKPFLTFIVTTTFAQIASLPIILYNFGKFYFIGFLSNIFLIPLSVVLILISLFSFIFPFGFQISGFLANTFLNLMQTFALYTPELNCFFPIPLVITLYSFLIWALLKNNKKIKDVLIFVFLLSLSFSFYQYNLPDRSKKIYFFSYKKPCFLIKEEEKGVLFSPDDFKDRNFLNSLLDFIKKQKLKEITLIYTEENQLNHTGTLNQLKKYVSVKNVWESENNNSDERKEILYGYEIEKRGKNFTIKKEILDIFLALSLEEEIEGKQRIFYLNSYKKRKKIVDSLNELDSVLTILPARRKKYDIIKRTFENYFLEDGCVIIELENGTLKISQL